jgi:zinc protease
MNLKPWIATGLLCASTLALAQAAAPVAPADSSEAKQAQPWKSIPIPPLPAFHPAQPKRIELKNGVVIFLEEDHELPFISGSISIKGGERDVPADKAGLVDLYSDAWRTS